MACDWTCENLDKQGQAVTARRAVAACLVYFDYNADMTLEIWCLKMLLWCLMTGPPVPVPGGSQPQPYMGEMAQMDSSHQTMMWQQNQYMVDSGIHSGSTTQAPSVSSKHGALDACEDLDNPQQMIYDFDRGYTHGGFPPDPINGKVLF